MCPPADHHNERPDSDESRLSETARAWVIRLASGRISAQEMREFKHWLDETAAHRRAFERERIFWQQLGQLETSAAWSNLQSGPQDHHRPSWLSSHRQWIFTAGGLTAACLALMLFYQDIRVFFLADHFTSVGQQRLVTLPDGGFAHLNTDTAISVTYQADERRIHLLRGEALFEVVPDKNKPFKVLAQGGMTQAVGTAFVVHAHGPSTIVTVTEGTVAVSSSGASPFRDSSAVTVHRGERTVYREGESPGAVETADSQSAVAWVEGKIVIQGLPFDQAVSEIDRYRPGRIIMLADPARTKPVSGRLTLTGIDEGITAFAATQGLSVIRVTDYLLFIL